MLKGHEHTTYELTDYEKTVLVPEFIKRFQERIGKKRAVTGSKIIKSLRSEGFKVKDGIRVRKIINYIRNQGLTEGYIVATSKGYFITHHEQEIRDFIESMDGRESEIRRTKESAKEFLRKKVTGKQAQINF